MVSGKFPRVQHSDLNHSFPVIKIRGGGGERALECYGYFNVFSVVVLLVDMNNLTSLMELMFYKHFQQK